MRVFYLNRNTALLYVAFLVLQPGDIGKQGMEQGSLPIPYIYGSSGAARVAVPEGARVVGMQQSRKESSVSMPAVEKGVSRWHHAWSRA
jgi:hypothetical protein